MADPFPTTLLILYFITNPAHVPPGQKKPQQEVNANWTLQATSQTQTEDPESCVSLATKMIKEFEPVNTSTIRLYCICPKGVSSELCFNSAEIKAKTDAEAQKRRDPSYLIPPSATVSQSPKLLRIGPNTPDPFAKQ